MLATTDIIIFANRVLALLMTHLLQRIAAEDVHGRIMATLRVDDQAILAFGSLKTSHVDDGLHRETAVVHHVTGGIIGIAQTLQQYLLIRITSRQHIFAGIGTFVLNVVGTGSQ